LNLNPDEIKHGDTSAYAMEINKLRDAGYEFKEVVEQEVS
jgi:hypothetical protein